MMQVDVKTLETRLFINNEFVEASTKATFATINPSTEEVIANVAEAGPEDIDAAVKAARTAFASWRHTDGYHRRDLLLRLAQLMEDHAEALAEVETLDNGKPIAQSRDDVVYSVKCYRYFAGWADKISGSTNPVEGSYFSFTKRQPAGVVGQIIPWNYPLNMASWKLAPALACGCTVVLKPAEQTPLSILQFAALVKAAGFPPGVVNIVPGLGPVAGAALAAHPGVDKIAFTGSTAVGRLVMAASANTNLKRVSLELGGKSPLVICADANLDQAVAAAAGSIFSNMGQVCSAASRLFVHADVYDEVVRRMVQSAEGLSLGDGLSDVDLGPIVSRRQFDRVSGYIAQGVQEGATVATGGKREGTKGYFIQPTIFTNVTDDMVIAKEEIFGPVLCIFKFSTLDEVIARANDTPYGLGAGICTQDYNTALKFVDRVDAGSVWVNCYDIADAAQPFGGFKQSGTGRELGQYALDLYTEVKTVMFSVDL